MKIASLFLLIIMVFSCSKRVERKLENTTWIGLERSVEYADTTIKWDEFNHILHFTDGGTFYRTYENGTWVIDDEKLLVTSMEGTCTRSYKIVKMSNKELILEARQSLVLPFVGCADGNENDPKITEVYERSK